jgi:hypothetical protein
VTDEPSKKMWTAKGDSYAVTVFESLEMVWDPDTAATTPQPRYKLHLDYESKNSGLTREGAIALAKILRGVLGPTDE